MSKIIDLRNDKRIIGGKTKRDVKKITTIVLHHSAGNVGDVFAYQTWWKDSKGWLTGGYHEIILRDGSTQLVYHDDVMTNGVAGHNTTSYHICYVGNGNPNEAQIKAIIERLNFNQERFLGSNIRGHNEMPGAKTNCPGINMVLIRGETNRRPSENTPLTTDTTKNETKKLTHKVVKGDTLLKIAKKYNVSMQNLIAWNNLRDPNLIKVGQVLALYENQNQILKNLDEIAKEVIAGKWGNGSERVRRLTSVGYDVQRVQQRVNELLRVKR